MNNKYEIINVEEWFETVEYIRSQVWTLENEIMLAIVNLNFAGNQINLQM